MSTRLRLDEAMDQIEEAIAARLSEKKPGGLKSVIQGYFTRTVPTLPKIHVVATIGEPDHAVTTIKEQWNIEVMLIAVVKNDDPPEGYKEAKQLAARARSIVIRGRTLNLPDFVRDVLSGRFEPSAPYFEYNQKSLYAGVAVVNVKALIHEPEEEE